MKDRTIQLPKLEKRITVDDEIINVIGNGSLTSDQVWAKMGNKGINHIRSHLPNMCKSGHLEKIKCESCNVGVKYRVKK